MEDKKQAKMPAPIRKRGALTNAQDDYQIISTSTGLSRQELDNLKQKFARYDDQKIGVVQKHEVDDVLRDCGLEIETEERSIINSFLDERKIRKVEFPIICELYSTFKKILEQKEEEAQNAEYVDAFVALGGKPDRSGKIKKTTIIDIIKNQFELKFNIEDFMEKSGVQAEDLSFSDFCLLFENNNEESRSLISAFSERARQNTQKENSFSVRYKDFEKWMEKNDSNLVQQ